MSIVSVHGRTGRSGEGISVFLVGALFGIVLTVLVREVLPSREASDVAHYREVRQFVLDNFVRDVDPDEMVKDALKGMVGRLDEYSRYYDEVESERVERETKGRFTGIGVVFRTPFESGQVLFPVEEGPAAEAGVRVGDTLLTADGRELTGLTATELRALLEGEVDSQVRLRVRGRDGSEREHVVVRRSLVDPTVRHARLLDEERGIGYLAIVSFSRETRREFDRVFERLLEQGMRGCVLDLRDNPGGVLEAAVEVARRFVPSGVIVSTEGRGEPERHLADSAQAIWQGTPMVVLVDGGTASAGEVLAGAFQDHRTAAIVGNTTHGKGVVQTIRPYERQGTIAKVTTSYYYTPAHRNLERDPRNGREHGIVPDLEVPIAEAQRALVHAYMQRYGPPLQLLDELRAWERQESLELIPSHPPDPQLDAALALLRGERPGSFPADGER